MAYDLERLKRALAGRYRVEREAGRGGMATVYLAHDLKHDRPVALKILKPELSQTLGSERFLREIGLTARLDHPHILPLLDSGEADGVLFYVMPYVEGESLRERLDREKHLPLDDAVRIAREVADALSYAHDHGIVHRDIKPENILLSAGHARVSDFGIARALQAAGGETLTAVTATGVAVGTPVYMSPEQAAGSQGLDGRSDQYALACVAYEMLAGRPPFVGPTGESVIHQHLAAEARPVTAIRPSVPAEAAEAIHRALQKIPADRFATALDFAEEIAPTPGKSGSHRPGRSIPFRLVRSSATRYAGVTGIVLALLVGGLWSLRRSPPSVEPMEASPRAAVLVADLDGSAEAIYRAVARDIVTTVIDESRIVAAVSPAQIRRGLVLAGRPDTIRLDEPLARELAIRGAIGAVVLGQLDRVGGTLILILRAVATEDGATIGSQRAVAQTDEELISVTEEAARRLREDLTGHRERLASDRIAYVAATPSLEAYEQFVRAQEVLQRGDNRGAIRAYSEAVRLDPDFARAWAGVATGYVNLGILDSSRIAYAEALRRPERLSQRQRLGNQAIAAFVDGDLLAAHRAGDELRTHHGVWDQDFGVILGYMGRYEEAVEVFERAVGPFGRSPITIDNYAGYLLNFLGRHDEALVLIDQLAPDRRARRLWQHALLEADWDRADSIALGIAGDLLHPEWIRARATFARASAHAARGRVREAGEQLETALASAEDLGDLTLIRSIRLARMTLTLFVPGVGQGTPGAQGLSEDPEGVALLAFEAALRGDTAVARGHLTDLRELPALELRRLRAWPKLVDAALLARSDRWSDVPGALRQANPGPWRNDQETLYVWWLLAEAHERAGQPDSAVVYLSKLAEPQAVARVNAVHQVGLTYPFANQRLVVLYARTGRLEDAHRRWQAFRQAFRNPDSELQHLVDEARSALETAESSGQQDARRGAP